MKRIKAKTSFRKKPQQVARASRGSDRRTPLPYYGAKVQAAKMITDAFPPTSRYVEPFCGSAAIFHAMPAAPKEAILSDHNPWVIEALRAVRDCPDELIAKLPDELAEDAWRRAIKKIQAEKLESNAVDNAVTMIVGWWASFNSSPWSGSFARKRGVPQYANAMSSGLMDARIKRSSKMLKGVIIQQEDAIANIDGYAAPGTLFFCDPPYMRSDSRGAAYAGYGQWDQLEDSWHESFLEAVLRGKAAGAEFVITSGNDELYRTALGEAGFTRREYGSKDRGDQGTAKHLLWSSFKQPAQELALFPPKPVQKDVAPSRLVKPRPAQPAARGTCSICEAEADRNVCGKRMCFACRDHHILDCASNECGILRGRLELIEGA